MIHKTKKKSNTPTTVLKLKNIHLEITINKFKSTTELKSAFDKTDAEVKAAATASVDKQRDVIVALAYMRAILSQRGAEKMRRDAGIKVTWTQYFKQFQKDYDLQMCLRTAINKMDLLAGKRLCPECKKAGGHTPSCSKHKEPVEYTTDFESELIGTARAGHDLVLAVQQGGNVDAAIKQYLDVAPKHDKLDKYERRPVKAVADERLQEMAALAMTVCSRLPGDDEDARKLLAMAQKYALPPKKAVQSVSAAKQTAQPSVLAKRAGA